MKAAILCRVSTSGQEEDGTSLTTQEERCREYAARLGFSVSPEHIYREVRSGADYDRPVLSSLLNAVQEKQVRAVVVYASDHLSRDVIQLNAVQYLARQAGCQIHSVTEEQFGVSPQDVLLQGVTGFVSAMEREKIKERTTRGKRARWAAGEIPRGLKSLYGYRIGDDRKRQIHEEEATVVRHIYRLYVDGMSVRGIAKQLADEGTTSPTGNPFWLGNSIHRILTHPAYRGVDVLWRARRGKEHTESEQIILNGVTPAIVSDEIWFAAQGGLARSLAMHGSPNSRNLKRPILLRGHMHCDRCKRAMQPQARNSHDNSLEWWLRPETMIWRCSSRIVLGRKCGAASVPGTIAYTVWDEVDKVIRDPVEVLQTLYSKTVGADQVAQIKTDIDATNRALAKLDERERNLLNLFLEGGAGFTTELISSTNNEIAIQRTRLHDHLTEIQLRLKHITDAERQIIDVSRALENLSANIDTGSFEGKRALLKQFGVQVFVEGRNYHIEWVPEGVVFSSSR